MTLKYKATNRYNFDWSAYEPDGIKVNQRRKTGLEEVPTDVLRNLWLAKFGSRAVTMQEMHDLRGDDIADVAQELASRNLVRAEQLTRPDILEVKNYYILEKENADH